LSDFDVSVVCDLTAFIVLPSAIFMLAMLLMVVVEAIDSRASHAGSQRKSPMRTILSVRDDGRAGSLRRHK
jgi:hypothetical protein